MIVFYFIFNDNEIKTQHFTKQYVSNLFVVILFPFVVRNVRKCDLKCDLPTRSVRHEWRDRAGIFFLHAILEPLSVCIPPICTSCTCVYRNISENYVAMHRGKYPSHVIPMPIFFQNEFRSGKRREGK